MDKRMDKEPMTTPALTVTFPPGNTIHYLQDFTFRIGMPTAVVFNVVKVTERGVELRAPGYGGKPYGNGCIDVSFSTGRDALLAEIARLRTALQKTLEGDADGLERLRAALDT